MIMVQEMVAALYDIIYMKLNYTNPAFWDKKTKYEKDDIKDSVCLL